jgi:hypothetical protein
MAKVTRILDEYGRPRTGAYVQFIKRVERVHLIDNKADYTLMLRPTKDPDRLFQADGFVVHQRKRQPAKWIITDKVSPEYKEAFAQWNSLLPWQKIIWKIFVSDLWWETRGTSPSSYFIKVNVARLKGGLPIMKYPYPGEPRIPEVPQIDYIATGKGHISIYMQPYYDYSAFAFLITITQSVRFEQMSKRNQRDGKTETLFWPWYYCFGIPKGLYGVKIEAFAEAGGVAGCAKNPVDPYEEKVDTTPWVQYTSF